MWGRGRRVAVECSVWALLALVLVPAAASAEPEPAQGSGTAVVSSRLSLDADRSGQFQDYGETTIRIPTGTARADRMLAEATADGGEGYMEYDQSKLLTSGLGLFEVGTLVPPPADATVEDGSLVLSTDSQAAREAGYPGLGPFEYSWDGELEVRSAEPGITADTALVLAVELDELTIEEIDPAPTALTREGPRTTVEWRFPPGEARSVSLSLDLPWATAVNFDIGNGGWSELRGVAALILSLAFLPALALLLGSGGGRAGGGEAAARLRRQAVWLTAAGVFACLAGLAATAGDLSSHYEWFPEPGWWQVILEALPPLLIVGFATAIQVAARPRSALWVVSGLGVVAAIAIALLVGSGPFGPLELEQREVFELKEELELPLFLFGVAAWLLVLFFMVDGVLRLAIGWLWPGRVAEGRRPWIAIAAGALALVLAGTVAIAYTSHGANLYSGAWSVIPSSLTGAMYRAVQLLPLAVLPGAIVLLAGATGSGPFLVRRKGLWLLVLALYVFFVVGGSGIFVGFAAPWSLLLGVAVLWALNRSRRTPLERLDDEVRELNPGVAASSPGASVLIDHRRELVDRALLVERMQRLRGAEHQKLAKSEAGGEDFVVYRERLAQLDRAEAYLEDGAAPPGRNPSAADRAIVGLKLPERPPVIYPALAVGPGADWRDTGRIALVYGARLAALPIAYVLYVLIKHDFGSVFDPRDGFELLSVLSLLSGELALWLVAAFVFGCLFSWLPWGNGPLKGLLLSLPVIVGVGLFEFCPLYVGITDWGFRCVQVLAFLSVLGLVLDWRTLRAPSIGLRMRDLADLYQVRSLRFAALNLTPFLLAGLGIYQQIKAGDPQAAVEQALKAASSQFPGFGGEGG